jgi:hypothetical protein
MRLRAVIYYENRADGVLVVAQQPQSFNVKHDSSYLLGLDPETGNFLWKLTLARHPATILDAVAGRFNVVSY